MRTEVIGNTWQVTFDSVAELSEAVSANGKWIKDNTLSDGKTFNAGRQKFFDVPSVTALNRLVANGFDEPVADAMRTAEDAAKTVTRDLPTLSGFSQTHDVAGSVVDIDRYLTGEPECMIDFPLVEIVKAGRVISLCAGVSASASIRPATLRQRGAEIVALALALSELGYALEVWSEFHGAGLGHSISVRTLVKGAHDEIDASRLMYALAHPSMLRVWGFGATYLAPKEFDIGSGMGLPRSPVENLPDGTIYLPCIAESSRDIPDAANLLRKYLTRLDLITEGN
jgi:hypothetical protein